MQNRFLFRAWTGTQMLDDVSTSNGYYVRADWTECEDYTLMQCTGLKDKSGQLIYESDIITDGIDKYIVEWDDDSAYLGFWVRQINTRDYYTFSQLLEYEVCGNIYESEIKE